MHNEMIKEHRRRSVERTLRAGIPAYFMDEKEGVVRVRPDGRKERILIAEGRPIILPLSRVAATTQA